MHLIALFNMKGARLFLKLVFCECPLNSVLKGKQNRQIVSQEWGL
jgi:hypothetical protein